MLADARPWEERRLSERVPLQVSVVLVLIRCRHEVYDPAIAAPVISSWTATTMNVSANGLLCETAAVVQAGEAVSVVWSVPDSTPLPVVLPARAIRIDPLPGGVSRVALQFLDVPFEIRDAISRTVIRGRSAGASRSCAVGGR